MRRIWKLGILGVWVAILGFANIKAVTYAQGVTVYFGTEKGYHWNLGEKSPMGFYLESEEGELTQIELVVTYDPEVLEFQSQNETGVTVISEGKFSLKQAGEIGKKYKKILKFLPLLSSDTTVEIVEATGKINGQEITIEESVQAAVEIPLQAGCELVSIEIDGKVLQDFTPKKQKYKLEVEADVENLSVIAQATEGTGVEISDTALVVGSNQIHITTTNKKAQKGRYTIEVHRKEVVTEEKLTVGEASNTEKIEITEDENLSVVSEISIGDINKNREITDDVFVIDEETESNENKRIENHVFWKQWIFRIAFVSVGILLIAEVMLLLIKIRKQQKRRNKKLEKAKKNTEQDAFTIDEIELTKEEDNSVVIRGNHICMDFDRAVNEYTSVKDLVIQTVKGQRIKETYRALNDISFEILRGEVIGVIGTNGAGKSTLLKIIAGAMYPTAGSVEVDRSKIQILTLGTGFDMELTGKENVYLNGAIIGYEKEFIEEHYDQIVEFAELGDFMNEKVKNYSCYMMQNAVNIVFRTQ